MNELLVGILAIIGGVTLAVLFTCLVMNGLQASADVEKCKKELDRLDDELLAVKSRLAKLEDKP